MHTRKKLGSDALKCYCRRKNPKFLKDKKIHLKKLSQLKLIKLNMHERFFRNMK